MNAIFFDRFLILNDFIINFKNYFPYLTILLKFIFAVTHLWLILFFVKRNEN